MKNQCLTNFGKTILENFLQKQHTNVVSLTVWQLGEERILSPVTDKDQPSGLTQKAGILLTAEMWDSYW
jgi:hypothetical protein